MPPHPTVHVGDVAPLTDPASLRGTGIFHEETDTAPAEAVDSLADLADVAAVGIEHDGEVLLRRLTETCAWKLPVATVADGEDYVRAIREQVQGALGPVEVRTVEGVWRVRVRAADADRTAARTFVVFRGTLAEHVDPGAIPVPADGVHDAGWFDALPEDAETVPGTDRFC